MMFWIPAPRNLLINLYYLQSQMVCYYQHNLLNAHDKETLNPKSILVLFQNQFQAIHHKRSWFLSRGFSSIDNHKLI